VVEGVGVVDVDALQGEREQQRVRDQEQRGRGTSSVRVVAQGRIMPRARFLM
jgi:hypothetical protein